MPSRNRHFQKPQRRSASTSLPQKCLIEMMRLSPLIVNERWDEAVGPLEDLNTRYPGHVELLAPLILAYQSLQDFDNCAYAAERLLKLTPGDADLTALLANLFLATDRPGLALQTFRRYAQAFPQGAAIAQALAAVEEMPSMIVAMVNRPDLPEKDVLDLVALNEMTRFWMDHGEHTKCRQTAQNLLARFPWFTPARNNLANSYYLEGRLDLAVAHSLAALELEPENVHALANLVHFSVMRGELEQARAYGERLRHSQVFAAEGDVKKAEGLSYLGDHAGVRAVFDQARAAKAPHRDHPLLLHLAAVAALHLGDAREARRCWKRIAANDPVRAWAEGNLEDLKLPVGERHGPWAFPLSYWLTPAAMQDLNAQFGRIARDGDDRKVEETSRAFLRRHPEVIAAAPLLLQLGGPDASDFLVTLGCVSGDRALIALISEFGLGQRGADDLRMRALQAALEAEYLQSGKHRVWREGEWAETVLMNWEITDEPTYRHAPPVEAIANKALEWIWAGEGVKAERLLEQARALEPDAPDVLNNLVIAYAMQGRQEEANTLLREIHRRFPDYVFAQVQIAMNHISAGELEDAKSLLSKIDLTRRLHVTEVTSLCTAHVELHLAEENVEAARTWLDMWEQIDPDHEHFSRYEMLVSIAEMTRWIKTRAKRRKTKTPRLNAIPAFLEDALPLLSGESASDQALSDE